MISRLVAGASPLLLTTYLTVNVEPTIRGNFESVDLWRKILAVANSDSRSADTRATNKLKTVNAIVKSCILLIYDPVQQKGDLALGGSQNAVSQYIEPHAGTWYDDSLSTYLDIICYLQFQLSCCHPHHHTSIAKPHGPHHPGPRTVGVGGRGSNQTDKLPNGFLNFL